MGSETPSASAIEQVVMLELIAKRGVRALLRVHHAARRRRDTKLGLEVGCAS